MSSSALPRRLAAALFALLTPVAVVAGIGAARTFKEIPLDLDPEEAREAVRRRPLAPASWHALTFAATREAGYPTAEALGALLTAYELAPFTNPSAMAWRVEYAALYWTAIPDTLQDLTLSQIAALGGVGETWPTRHQWCRTFPEGALTEAACATVPGTWRNGVQRGL